MSIQDEIAGIAPPAEEADQGAAAKAIKKAEREAKKAEKAKRKREAELFALRYEQERHALEDRLSAVEHAGLEAMDEAAPLATADEVEDEIERRNAEARRAFCEELGEKLNRQTAAWAARKLLEAKQNLKRTKAVRRAIVNRAKDKAEHREAFFYEPLKRWAREQPLETKMGFRLPEANLRIQLYPLAEKLEVADTEVALDEALKRWKTKTLDMIVREQTGGVLGLSLSAPALVRHCERTGEAFPGLSRREESLELKIVPLGGS